MRNISLFSVLMIITLAVTVASAAFGYICGELGSRWYAAEHPQPTVQHAKHP